MIIDYAITFVVPMLLILGLSFITLIPLVLLIKAIEPNFHVTESNLLLLLACSVSLMVYPYFQLCNYILFKEKPRINPFMDRKIK